MGSKVRRHLAAAYLCTGLCGLSYQAEAQAPPTPATPVEAEPQAEPQPATPQAEPQVATPQTEPQLGTTSEATPQVGPVPAYQPMQYELAPPGTSITENRSETKRWPNRPLMVTSTLMLTAAYVPTAIAGAMDDETSTNNLYIPVAGPWLELAREPANNTNKALLVVSGVFQDLGALGMLTSLFVPERRTSSWYLLGNRRLSAAPVADRHTYGVSARGHF